MSDFKERLENEFGELAEKHERLKDFLWSTDCTNLCEKEPAQVGLMHEQCKSMGAYREILSRRLALINGKG